MGLCLGSRPESRPDFWLHDIPRELVKGEFPVIAHNVGKVIHRRAPDGSIGSLDKLWEGDGTKQIEKASFELDTVAVHTLVNSIWGKLKQAPPAGSHRVLDQLGFDVLSMVVDEVIGKEFDGWEAFGSLRGSRTPLISVVGFRRYSPDGRLIVGSGYESSGCLKRLVDLRLTSKNFKKAVDYCFWNQKFVFPDTATIQLAAARFGKGYKWVRDKVRRIEIRIDNSVPFTEANTHLKDLFETFQGLRFLNIHCNEAQWMEGSKSGNAALKVPGVKGLITALPQYGSPLGIEEGKEIRKTITVTFSGNCPKTQEALARYLPQTWLPDHRCPNELLEEAARKDKAKKARETRSIDVNDKPNKRQKTRAGQSVHTAPAAVESLASQLSLAVSTMGYDVPFSSNGSSLSTNNDPCSRLLLSKSDNAVQTHGRNFQPENNGIGATNSGVNHHGTNTHFLDNSTDLSNSGIWPPDAGIAPFVNIIPSPTDSVQPLDRAVSALVNGIRPPTNALHPSSAVARPLTNGIPLSTINYLTSNITTLTPTSSYHPSPQIEALPPHPTHPSNTPTAPLTPSPVATPFVAPPPPPTNQNSGSTTNKSATANNTNNPPSDRHETSEVAHSYHVYRRATDVPPSRIGSLSLRIRRISTTERGLPWLPNW